MTIINEKFTLYVLTPPSLNGEKTRWLLDYHGVQFKNEQLTMAPMSLIPALRYAWKAKGSKYVYAVHESGMPVFRKPELLATYLDSFLAAEKRLVVPLPAELKKQYDDFSSSINNAMRPWSYGAFGCEGAFFKRIMTQHVPYTEKLFFYCVYPLLKLAIKKSSPPNKTAQLLTLLNEGLDESDRVFSDGRQFINGKNFTYADIEFAVTVCPMIMPAEYSGYGLFPSIEQLPNDLQSVIKETRQRPTGQYVLNLYKNLRKRKA